jgi:hypothetical protein
MCGYRRSVRYRHTRIAALQSQERLAAHDGLDRELPPCRYFGRLVVAPRNYRPPILGERSSGQRRATGRRRTS